MTRSFGSVVPAAMLTRSTIVLAITPRMKDRTSRRKPFPGLPPTKATPTLSRRPIFYGGHMDSARAHPDRLSRIPQAPHGSQVGTPLRTQVRATPTPARRRKAQAGGTSLAAPDVLKEASEGLLYGQGDAQHDRSPACPHWESLAQSCHRLPYAVASLQAGSAATFMPGHARTGHAERGGRDLQRFQVELVQMAAPGRLDPLPAQGPEGHPDRRPRVEAHPQAATREALTWGRSWPSTWLTSRPRLAA